MADTMIVSKDEGHPLAKFGVVIENEAPEEKMAGLYHAVANLVDAGADIAACLPPVLTMLNWPGTARNLSDVLPHEDDTFDITALQNVFCNLGYKSQNFSLTKARLKSAFPGILIPRREPSMIVMSIEGSMARVFNCLSKSVEERPVASLKGTYIYPEKKTYTAPETTQNWYQKRFRRYSKLLFHTLFLTGLSNLLALSIPIFVLLIYDRFIPTNSFTTWLSLVSGVAIAVLADLLIRATRRRSIEFVSARLGYLSNVAVINRLLNLPISMTETASVGAQVARLRDLERIKEFISGPLGAALLDLPFSVIAIGAIAFLAGWLAIVPVVAAILFIVCGFAFARAVSINTERSAKVNSQRQELVIEIIQHLRAIKTTGNMDAWINRFAAASQQCARQNFKSSQMGALIATSGQSLTMLSGLTTLGFGTLMAIDETLSTGALIATMLLVWRALAPMQGLLVFLTRMEQLRKSIEQTNRLMSLPPEKSSGLPMPNAKGNVKFSQVTFRYPGQAVPVISNLTFDAQPGEVIAVVGKNGAGKSSILKLIAGLFPPLAGRITIDDRDIRQINPRELRKLISFVSQTPHFFNGTIAENLSLSHPLANRQELIDALEMASAWEDVQKLPDGLETVIQAQQVGQFSMSFQMRLSLARAYLRKSPIVLFDEPITGLDFESEFMFATAIDQIRTKSTVFIITHRPSHLRNADKVLILEDGASRYFGAADAICGRIPNHLL